MRYLLPLFLVISIPLHAQIFVPPVNIAMQDEPMNTRKEQIFETAILNDPGQIRQFEKLEIGVRLPDDLYERVENFVSGKEVPGTQRINPYLEWELLVQAVFFRDGMRDSIVIDGFYSKSFTPWMVRELPHPQDGRTYSDAEYAKLGGYLPRESRYTFLVRFAPPEAGNWKWYVRIVSPEQQLRSPESTCIVAAGSGKGYIGVHPGGRYLALGDSTFFPAGMNAQWPESHIEFDPELYQYHISEIGGKQYYRPELYRPAVCVPRVYDKYLETLGKMHGGGVNYFRTIMSPVSTEIEWETLGDYSSRLPQAQEMDRILEFAEQNGMYIHWDMASHFTFKYNVYSIVFWDWIDSDGTPSYAYKKAFGLDHPTDFFRNPEAKKYYKQRLRYILARWGYSTHIGAFELICEISNIGSQLDDNDAYYHQNHQVYEDWQDEMGAYIKSQHNGSVHLLTASYSGEKHSDDLTYFKSNTFDIMTSNIYDFGEPDFSSFFTKFVSRRFLNESPDNARENVYTMECTGEGRDRACRWNVKPLLFSETEPAEALKNCSRAAVELNRSIWQSACSGLAASLSWSSWYFTDNYIIYGQVREFMSSIDPGAGRWHPGASKLVKRDSLLLWEYEPGYAAAMNSSVSKADLAYLRSGGLDGAIGVITNKTYNIYNEDSCLAIPAMLGHLGQRETVFPTEEGLRIKGMAKDRYRISYFLPSNQHEPIYVSEQRGSSLKIDLPMISATKEGYIVLFRVEKIQPAQR